MRANEATNYKGPKKYCSRLDSVCNYPVSKILKYSYESTIILSRTDDGT